MRSSPSEPVARRLSAIAGFYRYATDEDLIDRSPVAGVRRPKVADDSQTTGLDRDQLRAVLALARQRSAWCAASPGPPAWTAPSGSAPTACAMRSSPWPSTPACPCATYRTPPGTPTPRTTRRYDRARHNLDRAATYAVAAYLAGDGP